jgi:hypothetical protein
MYAFILDWFVTFGWHFVRLFSYAEIVVTRVYNYTILPVKESSLFKSIAAAVVEENSPILFVKDGKIILESTRQYVRIFPEKYDFFVDTTLPHHVIHRSIPEDFDDYIVSTAEFVLTELHIGEKKLQIKFINKLAGYTYAIVNNVIDVDFLMYFIRKHYHDPFYACFNMPVSKLAEGYHLSIIDGNVNMLTINEKQALRYSRDSYTIETLEEPNSNQPETLCDSPVESDLDLPED